MKQIFLPPYSKMHIIVLGSLTFFLAIGLLFTFKDKILPEKEEIHTPATVEQTTAEKFRTEHETGVNQLNNNDPVGALLVNNLMVVDVRSAAEFEKGHIAGALNITPEDLKNALLMDGVTVLVYGQDKATMDKAAEVIKDKGISSVLLLSDPINKLKDEGYTITQ